MTDMTGPYSAIGGPGSAVAVNMAVEDSGLREKGWTIDVISADHQNKPDVAASLARRWADLDNVDVYTDLNSSGVALAVNTIAVEKIASTSIQAPRPPL